MKQVIATLKSAEGSPIAFSRWTNTERAKNESWKEYESRIWRDKAHYSGGGNVIITAQMLKNCLTNAAQYLKRQIPGKGKATYTQKFRAGVMCVEALVLPFKREDLVALWLFVPSNGKPGGPRVEKCFPTLPEWKGDAVYLVGDPEITEDVFTETITAAGRFVGLGSFRPACNGVNGRFSVETPIIWDD